MQDNGTMSQWRVSVAIVTGNHGNDSGEEEEIGLGVEGGETDQDWTILGRDDKDESYSDSRTLYRRIDEGNNL